MAEMNESNSNPSLLSPTALAFVGDAVFELRTREYIVAQGGSRPAGKLHDMTVEYVCASAQARAAELLLPMLSPEEENIFRRGRNSNAVRPPKSSSPVEYRRATGLEALFGWLHLCRRNERIDELFSQIIAAIAAQEEK